MNALAVPLLLSALKGKELYDALYTSGYHANTTYSHSRILLRAIEQDRSVRTVLDFGCSHGYAVEQLWKSGRQASGYDVSQKAVDIAVATRTEGQRCLPAKPCFFSDSTILDTWSHSVHHSGYVDAVLSSDVLEHLEPQDVAAAVRRLTRMARKKLFLKIATGREVNKVPLTTLPEQDRPVALHTTVKPLAWWLQQFKTYGFRLVRKLGVDSMELARGPLKTSVVKPLPVSLLGVPL